MVKGGHDDGGTPLRASEVLGDKLLTARGKGITPKTIGQKRYVDAIRSSTVTFAIGPAGTGKTYLAVATAVRALQEHQVSRLILTRPAVEAGERLGFLPGTLYEKIDPVHAPALRRAVRDDGRRHAVATDGARHRRGRAARVHAGTHAERCVHHPGRGAEHDARSR